MLRENMGAGHILNTGDASWRMSQDTSLGGCLASCGAGSSGCEKRAGVWSVKRPVAMDEKGPGVSGNVRFSEKHTV